MSGSDRVVGDPPAGSSSPQPPDLREVIMEFGRLLDILSEELGMSLQEAEREFVAVGRSFDALATARGAIDTVNCHEPERTVIRESCKLIGDSLGSAVVALQYHDRLAQRVGHIRTGLDRLHGLLQDGSARSNDEWLALLRNIERENRVEQQRLRAEVLHVHESVPGASARESVELF